MRDVRRLRLHTHHCTCTVVTRTSNPPPVRLTLHDAVHCKRSKQVFPSQAAMQAWFDAHFPDLGLDMQSTAVGDSPAAKYTVITPAAMTYSRVWSAQVRV